MRGDRLSLALDEGLLDTAGVRSALCVGVSDPGALDALEGIALSVVQPVQPDHDRLKAAGQETAPDFPDPARAEPFDLAFIVLPRARDRAKGWIEAAAARLATGGWLVIDGARNDGVDGIWKAVRDRLNGAETLTKAHGRLIWGRIGADRFPDWRARPSVPAGGAGFITAPGVFSAAHADPGSAALVAALPTRLPARMADLGSGWGYLAAAVLARDGVATLDLVEADHVALEAAQANVRDDRARFHWADALSWAPPAPLDGIVMNPPFHAGRAGDPGIGRAFIARAAAILLPHGQLWLVANRHLPYEAELDARFQVWREIGGTPAFKVIEAARPRRAGKGQTR